MPVSSSSSSAGSSASPEGASSSGPPASSSVSSSSAAACTDTWRSYARALFTRRCNGCHAFTTRDAVASSELDIRAAVINGTMPLDGILMASTQARVLRWMDCGMPQ